MAFTCGFFNSDKGDRKYNAEQISAIFDGIIADGVFATIGDHMMVTAGVGMQVQVGTGKAWFDHTWNVNDSLHPLDIATSDVSLDRIDAIVLETNHSDSVRFNGFKVIKGSPAATPAKPSLTNTELIHQHPLAWVRVTAGATEIAASMIENAVGKSECPFVTGIIEFTNIDEAFNQWQGDFDEWFDNVKTQLSGDVAANLQRQIDECKEESRNHLKPYTKSLLGLSELSGPDDAFIALYIGPGKYGYRVKVLFPDGTPVSGVTITGINALPGRNLITDSNGTALGVSNLSSVNISSTSPHIDLNKPAPQQVVSTGTITDVTLTLSKNSSLIVYTSSTTLHKNSFSKFVKTIDISAVNGGGNGAHGSNNGGGGSGGASGYSKNVPIPNDTMVLTVGGILGTSQIKIDGAVHSFTKSYPSLSGGGHSSGYGAHPGGDGRTGVHVFDDASLPIIGSSGGGGANINNFDYSVEPNTTVYGGNGGSGAGSGGNATFTSYSNVNSTAGSSASYYGCGGGGGGGVWIATEKPQSYSPGGSGLQGAVFIRCNF